MLLDVRFEKEKEYLNKVVEAFNDLCENRGLYPQILEYSYFELYQKCPKIKASEWKEFMLEPKIADWYSSERKLLLQAQTTKLLSQIGDSRSTGQAQALTTMLKTLNETEAAKNKETLIVYNFIPLTNEEKKNPNIKIENAPEGLKDAIRDI